MTHLVKLVKGEHEVLVEPDDAESLKALQKDGYKAPAEKAEKAKEEDTKGAGTQGGQSQGQGQGNK